MIYSLTELIKFNNSSTKLPKVGTPEDKYADKGIYIAFLYYFRKNLFDFALDTVFRHYSVKEIYPSRTTIKMFTLCFSHILDTKAENEINILKRLDHPNILKITDFYNLKNEYNIITEYCQEGELFDEIKAKAPFDETLTGWYMRQILSAVCYCHNQCLKIFYIE